MDMVSKYFLVQEKIVPYLQKEFFLVLKIICSLSCAFYEH